MPADEKSQKHILVVDDEPRMVRFIRLNLEADGYWVAEAYNGLAALNQVRENLPDLVVLDVSMPELDGFETLEEIRKISDVPVIMLTVRGEEEDRIHGLELGADDYVTKPFSPRELASRIKAVLRRTVMMPPVDKSLLVIDEDLSIDFPRHEVIAQGNRVKLRPTEWRLLYHLVNNAGWVMSHDTLLAKVWGHEYLGSDHYVRLYITYLRQKIEPDPSHPKYIITERGIGYRFVDFRRRQLPKPTTAESS